MKNKSPWDENRISADDQNFLQNGQVEPAYKALPLSSLLNCHVVIVLGSTKLSKAMQETCGRLWVKENPI